MTKIRQIWLMLLLIACGLAGAWGTATVMADWSGAGKLYHETTFSYAVEINQSADAALSGAEATVIITPQRDSDNPADFSDAYRARAQQQAKQWAAERSGENRLDLLLVFKQPLTVEETNDLLRTHEAHLFESGLVGYANGTPFAAYTKENGPYLTDSLSDYGEDYRGVEPEIDAADSFDEPPPADVRGVLAVRVWVPAQQLALLLDHDSVDWVDITPQQVRDQLASDDTWRDAVISTVALEMPVWAYTW